MHVKVGYLFFRQLWKKVDKHQDPTKLLETQIRMGWGAYSVYFKMLYKTSPQTEHYFGCIIIQ